MIIIYVIALVFVGLIAYLLFAPFYIEVNSATGIIQLRFHNAASISVKMENEIYFELKLLGWIKRLDRNSGWKSPKPGKEKASSGPSPGISIAKLRSVLKSFQVTSCRVSVDTGDMQLNAMLFPLFYFLRWWSGNPVEINFMGKNDIQLQIRNSIARMGWAFISPN